MATTTRVFINCDGLCEPNPNGTATYGWIARDEATGKVLKSQNSRVVSEAQTTNNLAEYYALENALWWLHSMAKYFKQHEREAIIRLDSKLVVNQINRVWDCNAPALRPLATNAQETIEALKEQGVPVTVEWVPREENQEADELSQKAYKQITGHAPPERPDWQKKKPRDVKRNPTPDRKERNHLLEPALSL